MKTKKKKKSTETHSKKIQKPSKDGEGEKILLKKWGKLQQKDEYFV